MSNTLSTLRHLLRHPGSARWVRLERTLGGSALPTALVPDDQSVVEDTAEMRHYLAAQTSQVV